MTERDWLSDVNDTKQWDLEEKMQHMLDYVCLTNTDESFFFFLSLFCSFIFFLISCLSHCPCICFCALSFHAFSLVSFHRPEIRLEQAKSQWQWHSQRPDSGWVLISTYTGMHLLEQKHFSKNGILLLIA